MHTSKQEQEKLQHEVEILKNLDHPNIIKVFEFYQDSRFFYIVIELCSGGELFDKILNESKFDERKAAKTMEQILSAVNYCHKNKVVHRDLKPENILYDTKKPDAVLKIVDFGTSVVFEAKQRMNQKLGTPYYIAPEVLDKNYDEKCDIWSCGVIMFIILCGYPPFNGQNDQVIMERVKIGKFNFDTQEWKQISQEAKNLISNMLQKDPAKRFSAEQCLQDKWFQMNQDKEVVDQKSLTISLNNLKSFRAGKKLQDATWAFLVNYMSTKDEKNELMKVFQSLDLNKDGKLSREELVIGYQKILNAGEAEEEVDKIMKAVDKNASGEIDYTEWVMATINR